MATKTSNTESLLASLTSGFANEENVQAVSLNGGVDGGVVDDDAFPLAAAEDGNGENLEAEADLFGNIDTNNDIDKKDTGSVVGGLLSSSGLLSGSVGGGEASSNGSGGGGLFDAIDQEEEKAAREAAEQAARAEAEAQRQRFEEEERKRREVEVQNELMRERELAQQAGAMIKQEQSQEQMTNMGMTQQQQQQQQDAYGMGMSIAGMQDLNLNDDPLGYRPQQPTQMSSSMAMNNQNTHNVVVPSSAPVYSNVNVQPQQQQQPPSQSNPPEPNGPSVQRQTAQEADYGGASYYYSTTGNVQQVYQRPNVTRGDDQTSSYAVRSQMRQSSAVPTSMVNGGYPNTNGNVNNVSSAPTSMNMGNSSQMYSNVHVKQQNGMNAGSSMMVGGNGMVGGHVPTDMNTNVQTPYVDSNSHVNHPSSAMMQSNLNVHNGTGGGMNMGMSMGGNNMNVQHHPSATLHSSSMMQSNVNLNNHHTASTMLHSHPPQPQAHHQVPPKPAFVYKPEEFIPIYGPIGVTDPILVQSPGVFAGPPHWTYAVVVRDVKKIEGQGEFSAVVSTARRRFRHFVALEERLRRDCPGAILPPRPNKHSTRAIDEATTRQSAQFALQRARELETYLNHLRLHPLAGKSPVLKLFLTLPDHLGIAWPEVSSSIFTRLTEAGASTAVKVAEGTSAVISDLSTENQIMAGEDHAELLALTSAEGMRIGSVLQAVPKVESAIGIMADHGDRMGDVALEMQKLVNNVLCHEKQYSVPFEVLSSGLLRCGRRKTRLTVELGAAAQAFTLQHKLCKYERLAFSDRRSALVRRRDAKKEADTKAQKLVMQQHTLQSMGKFSKLDTYGREAAMSDEIAVDAIREAEEIGQTLLGEVGRIAKHRRSDWSMSLRVMAANMREAHAESSAIWEECKNTFLHHHGIGVADHGHVDSDPNFASSSIPPSPLQNMDQHDGVVNNLHHNIIHNH